MKLTKIQRDILDVICNGGWIFIRPTSQVAILHTPTNWPLQVHRVAPKTFTALRRSGMIKPVLAKRTEKPHAGFRGIWTVWVHRDEMRESTNPQRFPGPINVDNIDDYTFKAVTF